MKHDLLAPGGRFVFVFVFFVFVLVKHNLLAPGGRLERTKMLKQGRRDKLRGRLATQILHLFRLTAHKQHFRNKKYSILTFHYKTASVIEFMVTHANIL